ncbi:MAG: type II toxin-antitoxin system RelE/ParE family toxin [Planctomycetota bacterium]|nr:type II toxin-antitoxin system RelE/ParE family toxin [Planctomycetota bacterium]
MQESSNPLGIEEAAFLDADKLDVFFYEIDLELAHSLEEELAGGLDKIRRFPERGSFYAGDIRRFRLESLPCYIFYKVRETETVVYVIAHERENPESILRRLERSI